MGSPTMAREGGRDAQDVQLRFAFVVGGALAVLAFIWLVLDVPPDWDGCNDDRPESLTDAELHSYRWAALLAQGAYACALAWAFYRWSVERQQRMRSVTRIGIVALAVLVFVALTALALLLVLTATAEFPVGLLVAAIPLGLLAAVAALGAVFPAAAASFARDPRPQQLDEAAGYLLFVAGCLLVAVPVHVLWIVYQGSGWVIGC